MQELEEYIQGYFGIGVSTLSSVAELFVNTTLKKDDFLLKVDQYTNQIHFVKSGYLRIFAPSENGEKEITQWISSKGMFTTELSSFLFNTPSRFNIQALTDCEFYTINKERYNSIGTQVPNWKELDKLFIAKCFITLENRVFQQLSLSSEQKVKNLMSMNSDLFLQVPLQYIASMLGMTPETLSRVRKKMSS